MKLRQSIQWISDPHALTPIQRVGSLWLKRDDLFSIAGCRGGKVRICWMLADGARGLVAASHRHSPQMAMVANVARNRRIPCRIHTARGQETSEIADAVSAGAEIIRHTPGYNGVLIARAREDAKERGWREIPFGMESQEAIDLTSNQATNIPPECKRILVTVGIGMSLCGILHGLKHRLPVLAVAVGCPRPEKYIQRWAPAWWEEDVTLIHAAEDYSQHVDAAIDGVRLDPVYEAKASPYVEPGDLFWIVGCRGLVRKKHPRPCS